MKILLVGGLAGPQSMAGGVWRVAMEHHDLLQGDHETILYGGWLGPGQPPDPSGVHYIRLRRPFPGAQLRGLWSLSWLLNVWRATRGAEIVHIHLARDFFSTTAIFICGLRRLPVVVQPHGMLAPAHSKTIRLFDAFAKRIYLRNAAIWLTLTTQEESSLIAYGVNPARIEQIFNATKGASGAWSRPTRPQFAFISRLAERKQPEVFIRAALLVLSRTRPDAPPPRFILAGNDQGELAKVRALLASPTHAQNIEYVGELSPEEVALELRRSSAIVLPSRGEIFPMIAVESLAAGVPLIITDDSGISDILREHQAAIVCPPTVEAVAAAVEEVLRFPEHSAVLAQNGKKLVESEWSRSALSQKLLEVYERAVAERTRT
jgi:glycosyltransferase involved in cell wall biosynthesis